MGGEKTLTTLLESMMHRYDYIIIDTNPSWSTNDKRTGGQRQCVDSGKPSIVVSNRPVRLEGLDTGF